MLAGAQGALWYRVLLPPPSGGSLGPQVQALDTRLRAADARLTRLEQRPAPLAPGLGPLTARVAALEQAPGRQTSAGVPDQRVQAIEARLAHLEQRPSPAPPELAPLEAQVAALQARLALLEQKPPPVNASLVQRVTDDAARLAALENAARALEPLAARTSRIARIQAAFLALSVGRPVGEIPDAPPALARYAAAAPPTEAALRLAFPAAAAAALAAAQPAPSDQPLLRRLWAKAQDLVTVRRGTQVLIGDPAAGVLAQAQAALDAGDLAGAADAVASLNGPAAQPLAAWLDQARGLLAARAALATLAAQP